jgi:hypothetical protein
LRKSEITKDFIFLTLATNEAKDTLLAKDTIFNNEKITVSASRDKEAKIPSEI